MGHGINPYMPRPRHLSTDIIFKQFTPERCKMLRQIFLCGSYGDPILHPDMLDILYHFRQHNPDIWLYIHTNGGLHDEDYWRSVGHVIGTQGQIDFGIDGLEDTLDIYRRGVDYKTVIRNARAFISAGGRAQWNFIVFRHNQHQINRVQKLSDEYGFHNVLIRRTGRFYDFTNNREHKYWPVAGADGKTAMLLELPTDEQYRNPSTRSIADIEGEYGDMHTYFDQTPIDCDALHGRKVAINAQGLVLPCNFFNHNLYDRRFHEADYSPGANALSGLGKDNQIRKLVDKYGEDSLNLYKTDLQDIFESGFWQEIVDSWSKTLAEGRIFECAMTCGRRFNKVWDQNEMDSNRRKQRAGA